ncbi:hypothetical protein HID58_081148 [Brassica napus]|uniref:GCK domain-containing protein n=1 Tax=Brassica napus TaxID=3708 RepID=A0ABQ7Y8I5_BRANA|nr:hypothetical protein HID58_081148 [Brassica napus]
MGIIASTSRKTENSETSEPLVEYVDCKGEAEKKNEDVFPKCKEAKDRLDNCFIAHRDYHQPILEIMEPAVELVVNKIEALFPLVDTVSTESADQPEEGDGPLHLFMNGGACTESYMALEDFLVEVMETNEDICNCAKAFTMLIKCMDAHSDYYHPILDAVYDGEDHYRTLLISALRGDYDCEWKLCPSSLLLSLYTFFDDTRSPYRILFPASLLHVSFEFHVNIFTPP